MAFKHNFEWNDETKELIELRVGDELMNNKHEKIDGRFENKTIYPHSTAINLIAELERQISDMRIQMESEKQKLEHVEKSTRRVDKAFYEKFVACMSMKTKESIEANIKSTKEQMDSVSSQLEEIKKVMGRD